ncbi:MAG: QueT transporter family protein [Armatimonadota bacterium]|nr:QueT transporter family protein [Armatimonadota bacterium]
MLDAITMWRHTKMVVLVALSGAAYAAVMMPFKIAPIIPGFTEVRPGAGLPVVCGLLFGPAAAWGSAFGNVVGDVFGGMFGPGSIPGFIGNFLLAYVPYRMWRVLRGDQPADGSARQLPWFIVCAVAGALCCGVTIGFGAGAMGLYPYRVLALVISANNAIIGTIVAAILLPILYPLAHSFGLLYTDILDAAEYSSGRIGWAGMILTWAGAGLGLLAAIFVALAGVVAAGLGMPEGKSLLAPQVLTGGVGTVVLIIGAVLMSPLSAQVPTEPIPPIEPEEPPGESDEE